MENSESLIEREFEALERIGNGLKGSGWTERPDTAEALISHSIFRGLALEGNSELASRLVDLGISWYGRKNTVNPLLLTYDTEPYRRVFRSGLENRNLIPIIWPERESLTQINLILASVAALPDNLQIVGIQPSQTSHEERLSQQERAYLDAVSSGVRSIVTVSHSSERMIPLINWAEKGGVRTILLFQDSTYAGARNLTSIRVNQDECFRKGTEVALSGIRDGNIFVLSGPGDHTRTQAIEAAVANHSRGRVRVDVLPADFSRGLAKKITEGSILDRLQPDSNLIICESENMGAGVIDVLKNRAAELKSEIVVCTYDGTVSLLSQIKNNPIRNVRLMDFDTDLIEMARVAISMAAAHLRREQSVSSVSAVTFRIISSENVDTQINGRLSPYYPKSDKRLLKILTDNYLT